MRARGLEPPRARAHRNLNPARLPVPPHPREPTVADARGGVRCSIQNHLRCGSCEDDDHDAGGRPRAAGGGARGRAGRARPPAHARAPRRQRQDPRLPQGQGAARRGAAAHGPRGGLRGDDARVPALVGRRGDRRVAPAPGRSPERRLRDRAGRGRAVHVHGRVPAAAQRARCPTSSKLEGVQEEIEVPAEEVDAELERLREESSPLVAVDRRGADRRLRRGRHARQRQRQAGARGLHRRLPRAARHGPHVRGDRARAARHERRRDAHDRAAAAGRLPRRQAARPQRRRRAARALRARAPAAPARRRVRARRPPSSTRSPSCAPRSRTSYRERLEALARSRFRASVLGSLGDAIEVDLPPYTVAGRVEELLGDLARNVERQGVPFGTFLAADRPHDGAGHAGAAARRDRLAAPRARARGVRRAREAS